MENNDKVKVTVYTNKYIISGYVYLLYKDSYRGRLSDHLNSNRATAFIPVTEAKIYDYNNQLVSETDCIMLNRNRIEGVIEEKEKE